jgi:hypothetical protein
LPNISGTSLSSTTADPINTSVSSIASDPNNIVIDLGLASTADKAVKAVFPFLNELSNDEWWTRLLAAWIHFEVAGPPKSVCFFFYL